MIDTAIGRTTTGTASGSEAVSTNIGIENTASTIIGTMDTIRAEGFYNLLPFFYVGKPRSSNFSRLSLGKFEDMLK